MANANRLNLLKMKNTSFASFANPLSAEGHQWSLRCRWSVMADRPCVAPGEFSGDRHTQSTTEPSSRQHTMTLSFPLLPTQHFSERKNKVATKIQILTLFFNIKNAVLETPPPLALT